MRDGKQVIMEVFDKDTGKVIEERVVNLTTNEWVVYKGPKKK